MNTLLQEEVIVVFSSVCQLVINIISGLAGSHKEKLWSSLLRSRKELRRC